MVRRLRRFLAERSLSTDERTICQAAREVFGDKIVSERIIRDASGPVLTLNLRDGQATIITLTKFTKLYQSGFLLPR